MKKLFSMIFVIGLLWCNVSYSYQYCYKAFDTIKPIKNASFMNIGFLKLELECLNKTKEAKIFEKKSGELFEYVAQKQAYLLLEKGDSALQEVKALEQNYINSMIKLFMELK